MPEDNIPRRARDPRTGETPEPPREARADDPTHGVDPRRNRPAPGERPGLSGQTAHRGAMQAANGDRPPRRIAPAIGLVLVVAAVIVAASLLWA
ncbi:hypothetical protein P6F26_13205 [Roseibacterium sp. SDUM158017]|uniref:hypothetical protein n=1 Tax=Roseicyclus salinarum TaxID=3036773 RepID=UPI00241595B9|nr:hypothetical protein [Roseibacterium sp. SDUM158017]MDG4649397.1 hypothetical protein [Roseibacterium sp. SDUM158017]